MDTKPVISTISHDPGVGNDSITQKWAGKLRLNNKKPIKKLSRVLYGFLYRKLKALCNGLNITVLYKKSKPFPGNGPNVVRMCFGLPTPSLCNESVADQQGEPLGEASSAHLIKYGAHRFESYARIH
jgi:hypothetical protein